MGNLVSFGVFIWAAALAVAFLKGAVNPTLISAKVIEAISGPYDFSGFIQVWIGHIRGFVGAGIVLGGTFGAGFPLVRWLGLGRSGRPVFAVALGFAMSALAVAGLGFCGLLHPVLLGACALLGVRAGWGRFRPAWNEVRELAFGGDTVIFTAKICFAILFLLYMGPVLAPEMGWDAMTYHLRVPSHYVGMHKIYLTPFSLGSFYPFTVEMWFTLGQALGGDRAAKLLNFSFLPLAALSLIWLGREAGNIRAGWLAGLLFVSLPAAGILSVESYNDLEAATFTLIAVWAALRPTVPRIITAGIFCGCAMGCKYSGIWVVPICLVAGWMGRNGRRVPVPALAISAVVAGVVFSVWPVRSFLLTGNPVYPLLRGVFPVGGFNPYFTPEEAAKILPVSVPVSAFEVLSGLARFPLDFSISMTAIGALFGPLLFGFLPLLLFRSSVIKGGRPGQISRDIAGPILWPGREAGFLALAGCAYSVMWVVSRAGDGRYLLPVAALLAFPCAVAILEMTIRAPMLRVLAFVLVAIVTVGQMVSWTGMVTGLYSPWRVALGFESRLLYLSRGLQPHYEYAPMAGLINTRLPEHARILMFSDILSYYIDREVVFDTQQVTPPVGMRLFSQGATPEALRKRFRQLGIDWVYYTPLHVMAFQRDCRCIGMDKTALACYERFWRKYAVIEFDYMSLKMFRLRSESEAIHSGPGPFVALPGILDVAQTAAEEARVAGNFGGALGELEKVRRQYPDMSEVRVRIAEMYLQQGRASDAARELAVAARLGADSAPYWMMLSSARMSLGDRPGALAAARACVERAPTPRALTMLAAGLANNGDISGAREAVNRAARMDPFDEHVQGIARQLR